MKLRRFSISAQRVCSAPSMLPMPQRRTTVNTMEHRRPVSDMMNFAEAMSSNSRSELCTLSGVERSMAPSAETRPRKVRNRPTVTNRPGTARQKPEPKPRSSALKKTAGRTELRRMIAPSSSCSTSVSRYLSQAVAICLRAPRLELAVVDDGGGDAVLVETGRGQGVLGIRERIGALGGTLNINSVPGGVSIEATIPCESNADQPSSRTDPTAERDLASLGLAA
jgi:hypothetical protein